MSAGIVYVLINPTMPGLAKVGKTRRSPEDRVTELSSATGVPSPFIMAFQQPAADVDAAEEWVHKELERSGHRHSASREFFNAPLHKIIEVVTKCGNILSVGTKADTVSIDEVGTLTNPDLAEQIYEMGREREEGSDAALPDLLGALKCYEQAAALGHMGSCTSAGNLYQFGAQGIAEDQQRALTYFRKAVALGFWPKLANIAQIFFKAGQPNREREHWIRFFERAREEMQKVDDKRQGRWIADAASLYFMSVAGGLANDCAPKELVAPFASAIVAVLESRIEVLGGPERTVMLAQYTRALSLAQLAAGSKDLAIHRPFVLTVQEAFKVRATDYVVTGCIIDGTVNIGDTVTIEVLDGSVRTVEVEAIELNRQMVKTANSGSSVGLLFRNIDLSMAQQGCLVKGQVKAI